MPTPAAETAFLGPILARYSEDEPRLIYADFLDDSDEPADRDRAELIRVQCALARLPDDDARYGELVHREGELLQGNLPHWTGHLQDLAVGFEFRRGLLDSVSVTAAAFLSRGAELFRRAPVRRVRILDAARSAARLAACPLLASVRELDLCGNDLGNGGVNLLLRSPHLTRVQDLDLSFNGLCDGGLDLLARTSALPRLRSLALSDNDRVSGEGLARLAGSHHHAGLRSLDVSGNSIDHAGVRAVTRSDQLLRLDTLRIHGNQIGDAGAAALVGSPLLKRMLDVHPRLDLRQNAIGPAGAAALAASPVLRRAVSLDLTGNALGDIGTAVLARSPHLTGLRRLAIGRNHIGDAGAAALALSRLMSQLRFLDMSANRLTQKGVDVLWASRGDYKTIVETAGNFVSDTEAWDATDREGVPLSSLQDEIGLLLRRLPSALAPPVGYDPA